MARNITTLIIVTTILSAIMDPGAVPLIQGKEQVPCLFFMGDSLSDNGNNNFLLTQSKANYFPYGIDYPDGPTGRFCNGKNSPDFLAEFLGFDKPIPPFATANDGEILKGVNYASGSAGILDESGALTGDRISLKKQLLNHGMTVFKIGVLLGNSTRAEEHMNKCLYVVNMGSNDYLNNYLLPPFFLSSILYTPGQFAQILIKQYSQQLRRLYKYGARKIAVYGVGEIGCVPIMMSRSGSFNGSSNCEDSVNNVVKPFNNKLKELVDTLNRDLPNSHFTLINMTSISRGDPSRTGIRVSNAACCAAAEGGVLCDRGQEPCNNRNEYAFWDHVHPSENLNRVSAQRAYTAALPTDVYPFDIHTLVQK